MLRCTVFCESTGNRDRKEELEFATTTEEEEREIRRGNETALQIPNSMTDPNGEWRTISQSSRTTEREIPPQHMFLPGFETKMERGRLSMPRPLGFSIIPVRND